MTIDTDLKKTAEILPGFTARDVLFDSEITIVTRAYRDGDGLPVVLKSLRNTQLVRDAIARLQHEYGILRRLKSDRGIKAYDLQWHKGLPVIVMEDTGGESLDRILARRKLPLEELLTIAIEAATALAEIHASNIIHKDVAPTNIIYNEKTGAVRIIDFGIATYLAREQAHVAAPQLVPGTLEYMSPEQTGRMNRSVDYRADLYSFGATLYELLTRKLMFDVSEPIEWFHCHIVRRPKPPAAIDAEIPAVVSDIIMKLLEKTVEDRYQSALGVSADLQHCLDQLREKGRIDPFPLARQDVLERFQISQRLYGRERELEELMRAFERSRTGGIRLVLVSGPAGIGKSRLIEEIYKPVTGQRGYFVAGRYDRLHQNIPYSGFIDALRELVRQLLTESDEKIGVWRDKILAALGANARLMTDLIGALELIVGPQAPLPALPPIEAEQRFKLTLLNFIRACSRPEHPLVLVLHDLHWADPGTLQLAGLLNDQLKGGQLLVIGTYSDADLTPSHALTAALKRLRDQSKIVTELALQPLEVQDLCHLLADTLHVSPDKAEPLAQLVKQKTAGNPYFVDEFLELLRQQKLISFNVEQGSWDWDLERIREQKITDNVVDLVSSRLQRLSDPSQRLLMMAACLGNRFSAATLMAVSQASPRRVAEGLREITMEGLIAPVGGGHQLFELEQATPPSESVVEFVFAHDRVQQAAYSLLDEHERLAAHLRIGQTLQTELSAADQEERLFELVQHLNIASALIDEPQEQSRLCRLNLSAGKRAKSAASYQAAFDYLQKALTLLSADNWQEDYALTLELHTEAAEAAYLSGHHQQLELLLAAGLKHARSLLDRTALYQVRIAALIARGELLEAIELTKPVLAELGHTYPARPNRLHIAVKLMALKMRLRGLSMDDLRQLPPMTDPRSLAALKIGESVASAGLFAQPLLLPLMILVGVKTSLDHGYAPQTHGTYAAFGMILAGVLGEVDRGLDFGRLGVELSSQPQGGRFAGRTLHIHNSLVRHWKEPLRDTLEPLRDARRMCLESGDFEYAVHASTIYVKHAMLAGVELHRLQEETAELLSMFRSLRQGSLLYHLVCFQQQVLNLLGQNDNPAHLSGSVYDIDAMLPLHEQADDMATMHSVLFTQIHLHYLFGEHDRALQLIERMRKGQDAVQGFYSVVLINFQDSLVRLAVARDAGKSAKRRALRRVARNQSKLRRWARQSPANNLNKYHLVQAESLRVRGKDFQAHAEYDLSIAQAEKEGLLPEQALANELCGSMHMEAGRSTLGTPYLQAARELYDRWGAVAKVKELEARYPVLSRRVHAPSSMGTIRTAMFSDVNISSLMKALKVIASEHVHSRMVESIVRTAIEFAGAQSGALILRNAQGELRIEAEEEVDAAEVRVLQSQPLSQSKSVSQAVVNYVARTRESLVVHDAMAADSKIPGLSQDDYVTRNQVRSVLCLPIIAGAGDDAELIGMLYLENNKISNCFTDERFDTLEIICLAAAGRLELSRKAAVDGLTNLFNHDYFQNILKQEIATASRHQRELALIMLDIDNFKRFNDTWGHQAGDRVLREVADLIKAGSREGDTVARYGGEEMALILPGARVDEACLVAERIRRSIEAHTIDLPDGEEARLTISLGLASLGPAAPDAVRLVQMADKALYRSKADGKNRLTVA